jgi:phosphatidylinositol alpha-mannosyltransferase
LATVTGTLLSQTLLNLVALVALALLALPGRLAGHSVWLTLAWPPALAAGVLLVARLSRRGGRVARQLRALRGGLVVFRPARRGLAISVLQLSAWALQTLAAYALLRALDIGVAAPLATAAAILVAVNITAAVPITPSNIGVFQAACIGVLAGVGVASGVGLSYGLLLQGTELVTALVLGLPAAGGELLAGARAR